MRLGPHDKKGMILPSLLRDSTDSEDPRGVMWGQRTGSQGPIHDLPWEGTMVGLEVFGDEVLLERSLPPVPHGTCVGGGTGDQGDGG